MEAFNCNLTLQVHWKFSELVTKIPCISSKSKNIYGVRFTDLNLQQNELLLTMYKTAAGFCISRNKISQAAINNTTIK